MLSENGNVIKIDTLVDREYPKWQTNATMWLQFRANYAGARESISFEHAH